MLLAKAKVVLVDFDGVIIKNKKINKVVVDRIEGYVQHKLGVSKDSAGALNEILYKKHGHTVKGMKKLRPNDTCLQEFNDYVYTGILDHIGDIDVSNEIKAWQDFENTLDTYHVPYMIFTNAPRAWTNIFIDPKIPNLHDIIGLNETTLKPGNYIYKIAQQVFDDKTIFFIDDKVDNLDFPRQKLNWHTLHFVNDHYDYYTFPAGKSDHYTVSNLYAAADVITLHK